MHRADNLTTFSNGYDGGLLAFSLLWLFTNQTYADKCYSVFLFPLLTLVFISFSRRNADKIRATNILKMNLITFGLIMMVASAHYYFDFSFILQSKKYSSAIEFIKSNYLGVPHNKSFEVNLPPEYERLSYDEKAFVKIDNDNVSVIFPITPSDLDGILYVYVYALEKQGPGLPNICNVGHPINPPNENWYYCDAGTMQIDE